MPPTTPGRNGDLDISSTQRPIVASTTCGHSGGTTSPTWLVCSDD